MPKDFTDWITRYNKAMDWPTIVVPGGTRGAVRSPRRELSALIDEATREEKKLAKELGELNMTVQSLIHKVRDEKRDNEKFQAEHALRTAQKKLVELSAKHDIAQQLVMKRTILLNQMKELDKGIRASIMQVNLESKEIRDNPKGLTPEGHSSREKYDEDRKAIAKRIDEVRATPVTLRDPELSETRTFNGISTPDYTLLHTMLRKADALADTARPDEGLVVLDEVRETLEKMAKVRRGVLLAETVPTRNPEVATPVIEAEAWIAQLRTVGLGVLAGWLQTRLDLLDTQFVEGRAGLSLGLKLEDLVRPHHDFATECREIGADIPVYRKAVEEMDRLVEELRVLGEEDRVATATRVFMLREDGTDIKAEIRFVEHRNESLRLTVASVRDGLLRQENVNPDELRVKYGQIKDSVEKMYEHDREGGRKQQKDATTQQDKDVKKDRKIPREALDEINMRLKMAELLLQSNSLDAYKRAGAMLEELSTFQSDIKTNSKQYETAEKEIDRLKSDYAHFESAYRPYLPDRRAELKIAVDAFAKDYKKQDPKTNSEKIAKMREESDKIRKEVETLKETRKLIDKHVAKLRKTIESFGKAAVKALTSSGVNTITGYYGAFVKQLNAAIQTAEKSDAESLAKAKTDLESLEASLKEAAAVLVKWADMKSRARMTEQEKGSWAGVWDDILKGQEDHVKEEDAARKWRKAFPRIKERVKALKKSFKTLKIDMSDVEHLELDVNAHETQQKARPDHVAALQDLEDYEKRLTALEGRAKGLEEFNNEPIDRATDIVIAALKDFLKFVDGFDAKIRQVDSQIDTRYDLNRLAGFLDMVRDAVPTEAMGNLKTTADDLARDTALSARTRELREKALGDVRLIMGRMRTSAAIRHFATQTFDTTDTSRDIALAALDRLQVKLLTLLK